MRAKQHEGNLKDVSEYVVSRSSLSVLASLLINFVQLQMLSRGANGRLFQ